MKNLTAFLGLLTLSAIAAGAPSPRELAGEDAAIVETTVSQLEQDRRDAREKKDAIRFVCINDQLQQVAVAKKALDSRMESLSSALERGDSEGAAHEALIINELRKRVERIADEAALCAGGNLDKVNAETEVKSSIDEYIVPDPATFSVSNLTTEPPACASCYK